ncbi:hypothetical protein F3J23_21195 [Chryseobacterium sp. Tr-659]|uniref:hypothetical protein n=1 Tax=Chryseobacterium sp. Tr-659 TaxID=2608340 RepID=UPI0014203939|nr:hypothetical protein [Chryseobacterium sp. Tr-659]NIF07947.1 hypothetical protein [Chryseobacterium sp. Tr-659]
MKRYLILFTFLIPMSIWAQYLLPNEEVVYSFETKAGKKMALVKDKNNEYLQYRFGNKNHVEMEFPAERTKESWKQFKYRTYLRGGGKQNSGMDLSFLTFSNNGYTYQIFRTYYAEDESSSTGITITDTQGKETEITGVYKTRKGCLCDLEKTGMIQKEDTGL